MKTETPDQIRFRIQDTIKGGRKYLSLGLVDQLPSSMADLAEITSLSIRGGTLRDLTPLQSLTKLEELTISDCTASNLEPLRHLKMLRVLHIKSTDALDVTPLGGLTALRSVSLTGSTLRDWPALKGPQDISSLGLNSDSLGDLSPLIGMKALINVRLAAVDLGDLSAITKCRSITSLSLISGTPLKLAPLASLTNLKFLTIGGGDISDLSPLANLRELSWLSIIAKAPNLEPLANLTKLQYLDIRYTGATDLMPLARLVGLMVGTQRRPTSGGLAFSTKPVTDPFIKSIGRRGRAERVRIVLEYLRRKAGLSTLSEAIAEWQKDAQFESGWESVIERISPSPVGAKFVTSADQLVLDPSGEESDQTAAASALTEQLHEGVRRRAASFASMATRLDNQPGWRGIGSVAERFSESVDRPTAEIPKIIGTAYDALIELGSFIEFDDRVLRDPEISAIPLDPEIRRAFTDLIRASAPWIRQFPSARKLDEELGSFLTNAALRDPSQNVTTKAEESELITPTDAKSIQQLLEAATRGEVQSRKAGTRGVGTARNLAIKAMALLTSFYTGAISSDFATKSLLVQRAGTFLNSAESSVLFLFSDLPPDIRQALQLMLNDIQREGSPIPPDIPQEIFDRRRRLDSDEDEDV